ncbi:MAG: tetratricopeptide repeat protein [Candidatus Heimdallarchaeota archaeon]|nr:tetratricopeptide repeat protein [Candidatus Heimdallarchaeota archaeon]
MDTAKLSKLKQDLDQLLYEGKYKAALEELEVFAKKEKMGAKESINLQLIRSDIFLRLNKPKEALVLAKQALEKSETIADDFLLIDAFCATAKAEFELGNLSQSISVFERGEQLLTREGQNNSVERIKRKAKLLALKGEIYATQYKTDLAFASFSQLLEIGKELNDKKFIARAFDGLGGFYFDTGEVQQAIDHTMQAFALYQELGDKPAIAYIYYKLAATYHLKSDFKEAIDYGEKSLALAKELELPVPIAIAYFALGISYWRKGELDRAEVYLKKGLKVIEGLKPTYRIKRRSAMAFFIYGLILWRKGELDKAIEFQMDVLESLKVSFSKGLESLTKLNLALIYYDKGELEQVIAYCQQVLDLDEEMGDIYGIAYAYHLLAKTFLEKGKLTKALEYGEKSFKMRTDMENQQEIAETLFLLIQIALKKKDRKQANAYLTTLEQLSEQTEDKVIRQNYQVAYALILKASSRPRNWIKAMELLEKIVKEEIADHGITVTALINLSKLLLTEFRISGDKEVLLELEHYTEQMLEIAKLQQSSLLTLEAQSIRILTLWLKAQFSMVKLDMQKAKELLEQTKQIASESGLIRLASEISLEYDLLLQKLEEWDTFIRDYYEFIKS